MVGKDDYMWKDARGAFRVMDVGVVFSSYEKWYEDGTRVPIESDEAARLKADWEKRNGTFKGHFWKNDIEWIPGTDKKNPPAVQRDFNWYNSS